jgi:hypothetical protein
MPITARISSTIRIATTSRVTPGQKRSALYTATEGVYDLGSPLPESQTLGPGGDPNAAYGVVTTSPVPVPGIVPPTLKSV